MGFMAGAAIIVSLQQLKSLLGIVHFTNQMSLVPVMSSVFHRRDEVLIPSLKNHNHPYFLSVLACNLPKGISWPFI